MVLIDDSIVRGNTIGPIIKLLKDAGAREVHIRIASPPLLYPCYMGINIPTREELIANKLNPNELANYVGECVCIPIEKSSWRFHYSTCFAHQVRTVWLT